MNLHVLSLIFLFVCIPQASAQSETTSEQDTLRFYDVEIVVFKNIQGPWGLEYARPTSLPVKGPSTIEIQSPAAMKKAANLGYRLLQENDFKLLEEVEKVVRSPRYELMLHAAWRQPGLESSDSVPVWIRGGQLYGNEYSSIDFKATSEPTASQLAASIDRSTDTLAAEQNELDKILGVESARTEAGGNNVQLARRTGQSLYELEGQITVSLARYLHLNADLILRKPRPVGATQASFYHSQGDATGDSRILENHRLQERRRMRSVTLHYLDSPHFSMLVMISPYEKDKEENTLAE